MNQQSTFNVSDWLKHVRLFVCVVCLCCLFVLFVCVVLFCVVCCVVYLCCLFVCVFLCCVVCLFVLIVFADSYLLVSLKKKDIPHSSSALNFTD